MSSLSAALIVISTISIVGYFVLKYIVCDGDNIKEVLFPKVNSSSIISKIIDPKFGEITYDGEETGIWQTDHDIDIPEHKARLGFSSIPGTPEGPYPEAKKFLLSKKHDLEKIWNSCEETLRVVCKERKYLDPELPVRDQFELTGLSLDHEHWKNDPKHWEVCFEPTTKASLWVFIGFVGDEIEYQTCDS
ncbi:MAG: hypothetical protein ABIK92_09135 [Pseudomonadota bacterium]